MEPFANNSSIHGLNASFQQKQELFFRQNYTSFIVYVVVARVISLFSIVSNAVCLRAIATRPALRRRGNILVAHLVLLNILLSLTVHPVTFISVLRRQYGPLGSSFCYWVVYYFFMVHGFMWQVCSGYFRYSVSKKSIIVFTLFMQFFTATLILLKKLIL